MLIEVTFFLTILWIGMMSIYLRPVHALIRARSGK